MGEVLDVQGMQESSLRAALGSLLRAEVQISVIRDEVLRVTADPTKRMDLSHFSFLIKNVLEAHGALETSQALRDLRKLQGELHERA